MCMSQYLVLHLKLDAISLDYLGILYIMKLYYGSHFTVLFLFYLFRRKMWLPHK